MDAMTTDRLMSDVRVVLGDAEQLLKQAADSTGQQAVDLRDRAAETLRRAKSRLGEAQDRLVTGGRAAAQATDGWVHEHPWTAIGAGLGVGFLIGLLVGRR